MGLFSSLTDLCFGARRNDMLLEAVVSARPTPPTIARRGRRCQIESLEPRQMMAANPLAPPVILGSVYFEEATGDDSLADVIQVSFKGGAAGTTLDRLVINGDKQGTATTLGDGLTTGDVFFDTEAGWLGAFKEVGYTPVSYDGFTIKSVTVVDGGSQIIFEFIGFDAGEVFSFTADVDEAQFVEPDADNDGQVTPDEVDENSLVEGGEFQRSIMTGEFSAPHYVDLTLSGLFWDEFDDEFNAAQTAASNVLGLPNDAYSPGHDYTDRSAGAVAYATQQPLATISGWVYHDRNDNGVFAHGSETGIGGVTIELLKDGLPTGITTTTSTSAGTVGYYEFDDLVPGSYGVREVQPSGWLDGKDAAGSHGGTAGNDIITGAVLSYNDDGVEYNFGELLPGSIRGTVQATTGEECNFDQPEILLSGVQVDLLNAAGQVIATTQTDENGAYEFTGLVPGNYQVREHQPLDYYDGDERVGTSGGASSDIGNTYSLFTGIQIGSGVNAFNYDFCEHVGVMLSGNVYHDRDDDGVFDRGASNPESGIGNVIVELYKVNESGQLVATGLTATTDSAGFYKFNNLEAGKYAVKEIHPAGWLDGKDTAGNLGGVVATPSTADTISMIMIGWGQMGTEYNFGELLPGSISGRVIVSYDMDCDPSDPNETPIAGVRIDLLNAAGVVIATTLTDSNGEYKFDELPPGTYAVREHQPAGYFDMEASLGSNGGVILGTNDMGSIYVGSDQDLIDYGFCETPPGSISGQVSASTEEDCNFDSPEILLSGVTIELRDGAGNLVATTTTDANGRYSFTNLRSGEYSVHEIQPAGYYDGDQRVGDVGGIDDGLDTIYGIMLPPGRDAVQYDFCEHVGVMLSGYVYHDRSDDGIFDRGANPEQGIGNVVVKLLKVTGGGQLVDTGLRATTDSTGFYKFNNLEAGKYAVMEIQPAAWLDGKDTPGNLGGVADVSPPGDMISMIMIGWGEMGTEYNFGELLPGSIRGRVIVSADPECDPADPNETPIAGVQIDLLDVDGNVIRSTTTNSNGEYAFTNLRPGRYSVREHQPGQYFDKMSHLGSGNGIVISTNELGAIDVGSDEHLIDYGFCEEPPAELSGYVFIDGAPIISEFELTPEEIAAQRDGTRTSDDTPLGSVTLKLIDPLTLLPIQGDSDFVLPGAYPAGNIEILTDASGFYRFTGLRGGVYAVVEVQPEYTDALDTAGQHGGVLAAGEIDYGYAVNIPDSLGELPPGVREKIEEFRAAFGNNAIVAIPLPAGEHSRENNFSEVVIIPPPPKSPPPPPFLPPETPVPPPVFVFAPPGPPPAPRLVLPPAPPIRPSDDYFGGGAKALGYTWHLSVVDAGQPRSVRVANTLYQFASAEIDVSWQAVPLDAARWTLARVEGGNVSIQRDEVFGNGDAVPVTGDFDGDGNTDVGVFLAGRWYLDLNGNGKWDEGDLWAMLGTENDLPVTGDWDDDGKTDIGIYGPAWPRDPWAIENEPGLPDAANHPTRPGAKAKNMPPRAEEATSGGRVLKRTAQGKPRADLIDHVFHYGVPGDVPLTGDWNGDGIRDIGVFRDGQWSLDTDGDGRLTETDASASFGGAGDLPVVGDFNADGIDDVGIYRAGHWVLDMNGDRKVDAHDQVFELGGAGDVPVIGDWNGDGTDDPGTYHPANTGGASGTEAALPRRAG